MNISFFHLVFFQTMQSSPLITKSPYSLSTSINLCNCKSQYSFSTFFSSSPSYFYQNKIYKSVFNHFLNSVFTLESVDIQSISGISQQNSNPIVPTSSFQCQNSLFYNNSTPYNGACISVTTNVELLCIINETRFTNNQGGIGGAIFFSSTTGNASIINSYFGFNQAQIASHAFFLVSTLIINGSQFQQGIGSMSSLQLTAQFNIRNSVFWFYNCHFFRNEAPISFELLLSSIMFSHCCFLNYKLDPNYPYINNFFQTGNRIVFSFERCSINTKLLTANSIYISQIEGFLTDDDPNGYACMIVPTPSQTNGEKWSSKTGILTIFTIVFFCVISIIGILIVSFCRCDKYQENIENTDGEYLNHPQEELDTMEE